MGWIALAEEVEKKAPELEGQRIPLEELEAGQVFSINTQATKFELKNIDIRPSARYPSGQIVARAMNESGTYGPDMVLDYGIHKGMEVHIWGHAETGDVSHPYGMYERVHLKSSDLNGVILDVNKSKFPDCGLVVVWESPLNGRAVTDVHGHEIESLGEKLDEHKVFGNGGRSFVEIRQIVLDLRGKHDKKYEDRTKGIVREQIEKSLEEHAACVEKLNQQQKEEVQKVCREATQQFAPDLKAIATACVLHVSAGEHNYEADQIGSTLSNYADSVYRYIKSLTRDSVVASQAAVEVLNVIAESALKSYYMTREGMVRPYKGKWSALSEKGKVLGSFPTKKQAVKRLRYIEHCKRHGESIVEEE